MLNNGRELWNGLYFISILYLSREWGCFSSNYWLKIFLRVPKDGEKKIQSFLKKTLRDVTREIRVVLKIYFIWKKNSPFLFLLYGCLRQTQYSCLCLFFLVGDFRVLWQICRGTNYIKFVHLFIQNRKK